MCPPIRKKGKSLHQPNARLRHGDQGLRREEATHAPAGHMLASGEPALTRVCAHLSVHTCVVCVSTPLFLAGKDQRVGIGPGPLMSAPDLAPVQAVLKLACFCSSTFGELKTVRLPKKVTGPHAQRLRFATSLTKQDGRR